MAKKVFGQVSLMGILALLILIAFVLMWKKNKTISNFEDLSTANSLMMYEPEYRPPPKEYIRSGVSMSGGPSPIPPGIKLIKPQETCGLSPPGGGTMLFKVPSKGFNACVSVPLTQYGLGKPNEQQLAWLQSVGASLISGGGMGGPSMGGGMAGPSMGGMAGPSMGGGMGGSSMGGGMAGSSMSRGMAGPSMGRGMGGSSMGGPSSECMQLRKVKQDLGVQLSQLYEKQKYYKCI